MTSRACTSPRLYVIVDQIRAASPSHGPLSGWQHELLKGKVLRSGLLMDQIEVLTLADFLALPCDSIANPSLIVGMGERVLSALTGRKSIDKWQLSPLVTNSGQPFIPTFGFDRIVKQWELGLYLELTLRRASEQLRSTDPSIWARTPERFLLNPGVEETIEVLRGLCDKEEIAVDIETGHGQINTIGFAWSESDAIAINVLPERCGDTLYYALMSAVSAVLQSESRKILQNFIYDCSYLSAYGIPVRGEIFDTMWAMKVLWPEFKSGLDNVGRIYTKRPYWKDDGRVSDEEGKKKDWGNVRDWTKHYQYNCRDTTGTLDASRNQRADLLARGIGDFFSASVQRLTGPLLEMCARGVPVATDVRDRLVSKIEGRLDVLGRDFRTAAGAEINPRAPKQVLSYLRSLGVTIPKKFDKEKGSYRETADAAAIKKIRLKVPENRALAHLQEIKTLEKALSSYVKFDLRPDGRLSYSLNGCGTETLRMAGHKDPWDRGFNIQTIPREGGAVSVKSMFVAPEGWSFIEADLKAAETYYVAYASHCKRMIEMLRDGEDIHRHVAHAILAALGRPPADYSKQWRNLGKKTGHGANYMMKGKTFVENVFKDMDMLLSPKEGDLMLGSYFREFPEIRAWHGQIRHELYHKRKLTAPSGWERYFYGRPGDDMLREAVAWAPQHTVPWIINHMMFYLCEERKRGNLEFQLLVQVHDALYLLVRDEWIERVGRACLATEAWHPRIILPGGELKIPVEVEIAKCMAEKRPFEGVCGA